ncbi:hypothetical protein L1987_37063 [Smallanthus sonchifolius]|uniref:Uncharacterized protein n=1 Tax=Smallanthus sonchifolius TaxID=185202 RepID=A0ACB9HGK3_9ASTR|nr:hypothetical protein L1987_37063 [Smallanthus sonchifolius]
MALVDDLQSLTLLERHAMLEKIYNQLAQFPIPRPIELSDLPDVVLLSFGLDAVSWNANGKTQQQNGNLKFGKAYNSTSTSTVGSLLKKEFLVQTSSIGSAPKSNSKVSGSSTFNSSEKSTLPNENEYVVICEISLTDTIWIGTLDSSIMGFLDLFCAASMPVLKVLIVTALGSFLALDSINILGQATRKHVNEIVFFVFNPALIVNISISRVSVIKICRWFMPVNILLTFIIGSALGWVLLIVARPPKHLKGLIIGSCAAGNMGNMLLIILPAVCKEKASPFGDPDVCYEYSIAYASLSLAIGAVYLWLYVYNLVRVFAGPPLDSGNNAVSPIDETVTAREDLTRALLPSSLSSTNIDGKPKIVGFAIGTVTPMRKLLIGTTAPLRVIQDSVSLVGDAAIPIVTLIVGGNLIRGLKGSGISLPIVFGIVSVRYVLLPLSGILMVKGAVYLGFVEPDPLYVFVLLLQFAVPPAMNTGTIMQLFGVGESECSVIMLWTYGLASVSLSLWSTLFMWIVSFD